MTDEQENPYKYFDTVTELVRTIAVNGEDIEFWSGDEGNSWDKFTLRVNDINLDESDTWFALEGHLIDGREIGVAVGLGTQEEPEHTAFITLYTAENSRDEDDEPEDGEYTFVPLNYLRTLMDPTEERDVLPHLMAAAHLIHAVDESLDIRFMLTDNHVDKSLQVPTILGMHIHEADHDKWQQLDGQHLGPWVTDVSLGSFDNEHWNIWVFLRVVE